MPNRIIKESICYSESIKGLSWFEEVFFYRLIVNADDYGRLDGRAEMLQAKLFPLRRDISEKTVANALNALTTAGMVRPYMVEQKPFLQLTAWERHQQVRATKSKYPDPPAVDINCNQAQSDVPVFVSDTRDTNTRNAGENFKTFWDAYPKKKSKGDAEKAFKAINPDEQLLGAIIAAVEKQKLSRDWQKDGGQYIPYPATWLRAKGWEDEDLSVVEQRRLLP